MSAYVILVGKIKSLRTQNDYRVAEVAVWSYSRVGKKRLEHAMTCVGVGKTLDDRKVGDRGVFRGRLIPGQNGVFLEVEDFEFPPKGDQPPPSSGGGGNNDIPF